MEVATIATIGGQGRAPSSRQQPRSRDRRPDSGTQSTASTDTQPRPAPHHTGQQWPDRQRTAEPPVRPIRGPDLARKIPRRKRPPPAMAVRRRTSHVRRVEGRGGGRETRVGGGGGLPGGIPPGRPGRGRGANPRRPLHRRRAALVRRRPRGATRRGQRRGRRGGGGARVSAPCRLEAATRSGSGEFSLFLLFS